jgi:hypothetical protein
MSTIKIFTGLSILSFGFLFTLKSHAGQIAEFKVGTTKYSISFEGEGEIPPVNRMIKLLVSPSEISPKDETSGVNNVQNNSALNAVDVSNSKELESSKNDSSTLPKENSQKAATNFSPSETLVGFNAVMPDHGHGMFVKPVIKALGSGKYEIQGVKLHMKGSWQIETVWKIDQKSVSNKINLNI